MSTALAEPDYKTLHVARRKSLRALVLEGGL